MVKILFIMRQMQFKIIPSRGTSAQLLCEKEKALFLKITSSTVSWFVLLCSFPFTNEKKRFQFGKIISLRFQKNLRFWITRILEPDLLKRFIVSGDNHKIDLSFCQFLSLLFYFIYFILRGGRDYVSFHSQKIKIQLIDSLGKA